MLVSEIGYLNLDAKKFFEYNQSNQIQNKSNLIDGFGHYNDFKPYAEKKNLLFFLKSLFLPKSDDCQKSLNLIS